MIQIIPKFSAAHWGGAESSILYTSRYMESLGFRTEVWTADIFEPSVPLGAPTVRRFKGFYLSPSEAAHAGTGKAALLPGLLLALFREPDVDLIHIHVHNRLASLVSLVARLRGIPTILSVHSRVALLEPRWRYRLSNESALKMATRVLTVDPTSRESIERLGVAAERIRQIPLGVDMAHFAKGMARRWRERLSIRDGFLLLVLGRVDPTKNQRLALEAFLSLGQSYPNMHLAIAGFPSDDAYLHELREIAFHSAVADRIHMIPGVKPLSRELADLYAAADLVIVPSMHEAFSLVIVEAWAAGRPVIASSVGGPSQLIAQNQNGMLFSLTGGAPALSSTIEQLFLDPSKMAILSNNGRKSAQSFSWQVTARTIATSYDDVLGETSGRPRL